MKDIGYRHDPATRGMQLATYRCRQCGEQYPMLVWLAHIVLIGGKNINTFASHGPGCTHQEFDRITDPLPWPQPSEALYRIREELRGEQPTSAQPATGRDGGQDVRVGNEAGEQDAAQASASHVEASGD